MYARLLLCSLLTFSTPLLAEPSASHLDQVIERGHLNVCTTGDYKPYTYLRDDGSYEGIDIAMAQSLGKSLGVEVKWVKTSWKTLMPDFLANKCDIAVGGISVSLERQKKAFFSDTLGVDGKIPWYAAPTSRATRRWNRSTSLRCA